jgi:dihydrofolate reductase
MGTAPGRIKAWIIQWASVAEPYTSGLSKRERFGRCLGRRVVRRALMISSLRAGFENIGAWILGRNMFGPVRGQWLNEEWKGWWDDNPPYHCPVYVLTHHRRPPLIMQGGTTFYFVIDGIHAALRQARDSAGGREIRIGGGVATIREYLEARLLDELHLAVSPVLLGRGENLFSGLDLPSLGYGVTEHAPTEHATHVVLAKSA